MESIDDPLTDSQNSSTNTTNTTLPQLPPTSQQLHPNLGPAKAGSNTSSYRAPRASWRQQGLITQPEMGKPGSDCLREQTLPWTTDKRLAVKHCLFPVTGSSGFYDCSLLLSVVGSKMSRPPPLHTICLLCEVSSARSCHGGSDTLNIP